MRILKVIYNGKILDIRAVWMEDKQKGIVKMIDQRLLPWKLTFFISTSYAETAWAIKHMVVRGAPTIGVTAAYGVYQAALRIDQLDEYKFLGDLKNAVRELQKTRPTAVNLFNTTNEMLKKAEMLVNKGYTIKEIREQLGEHAEEIVNREVSANKRIGEFGETLIKDGYSILTHCNAGALAAVDYGTALAPIRFAHYKGKKIVVYVDETRPWLQGARLTAWELEMEGIPYYLISDNAAGYFMWRGDIDIIIVGADRITMNGDVANKIGTYKLAIIAKENGIPFYVAAPLSSFDPNIRSGEEIPIEERSPDEILYVRGELKNGDIKKVLIAPKKAKVRNPVFDITPAKYITGYITEIGILRNSDDIREALKKR